MANERSGGDLYQIAKLNPVVGASYGIAHLRTMCVAEDLDAMQKAAHAGKIVCLKAWPGFSWQDAEMMKKPHDELHRLASERLVFPLACFLVAAESHCYFCYTWGYTEAHGTFDWYPEFDKPLGKPKGDAVRNGWTYNREFERASVSVDLEKATANISWR